MTKIPPDDILEGLYNLRIRVSEKLTNVLELYDLEIHQKKIGPDYHRLKTMVKRSIEQEIRNKNFGARNGNDEKNAVVKNQGTKLRGQRILGDCWQWETNGQCVKGNNCSFRHDINKRGKVTPSNPSPNSFMQQNERKPSRSRSPRGKSPSGSVSHALLALSTLPRQSLSPPLTLLDPPFPSLLPPWPLVSRSLRPTPTTNGTRSLTHTVSLAPRLPLPSRLPPLELVGVLATSVADDSARLPSAPCGGTSSPLPLPVCPPPGRCVHAGGFALALCTLSWVLSSYRPSRSLLWLWASLALRDGFGVVPGAAPRSVSLRSPWSSPRVARLLWRALPGLAWWPSHLAKRSHGCWACRFGPYPLAHRCGDCWWCHDEAHRAQRHRPWGVDFRRPFQAAVPFGVFSCRRALLPVLAICARPVFSTSA